MPTVESSASSCLTSRLAVRQTSPACRNRYSMATISFSDWDVFWYYVLMCSQYFGHMTFQPNHSVSKAEEKIQHQWCCGTDHWRIGGELVLGDPVSQPISHQPRDVSWLLIWLAGRSLDFYKVVIRIISKCSSLFKSHTYVYKEFVFTKSVQAHVTPFFMSKLPMRFSFGSGEWRNGADSWKHWVLGLSPANMSLPASRIILRKQMKSQVMLKGAGSLSMSAWKRWWSWNVRPCLVTFKAFPLLTTRWNSQLWSGSLKMPGR